MQEMDWKAAEARLTEIEEQYLSLPNNAGWFVLGYVLPSLEKRFAAGERTEDLYREISMVR